MKRMLKLLLCIGISVLLPAQQREMAAQAPADDSASATGMPVKLHKGTFIAFELLEAVSSADARNGQTVRLAVREDVKENGVILIPKGSPGVGAVKNAMKSVTGRRDGYFEVVAARITLPDGTELRIGESAPGEDSCGSGGSCRLIPLPLAPLYLAGLMGNAHDERGRKEEGTEKELAAGAWVYGYSQRTISVTPAAVRGD